MRPHQFRALAALLLSACAGTTRSGATFAPALPDGARVSFLHINDVYEITPIEGGRVGGLARIATLRKQLEARGHTVIMTHGGDFLSPSALGTARVDGQPLAGRQMVAVLNATGLQWATLGNHELDFSEQVLRDRIGESRFRYVISNVTDTTGALFPGTVPRATLPITTPFGRVTIGLVGTLSPVNRAPWVRYADQYESVKREVAAIRDSVDAVVAITHQYYYEDDRLLSETPGLDLVLGGHEHDNFVLRRGDRLAPIVKADGNARTAQLVTLHFPRTGGRPVVTTELVPVTGAIPEDSVVKAEVERWLDRAFAGYVKSGFAPRDLVAVIPAALDAREATIRARSSNMTDLMLAAMQREDPSADIGIFNAGSIRIDDVVPAGPITQYDIIRILPFGGPLVRVQMTGRIIKEALLAGRLNVGIGGFLHSFGARVERGEVLVGNAPIEPDRVYRVITTDFLLTGRETRLAALTTQNPGVTGRVDLRDVRMALIDELRARYP